MPRVFDSWCSSLLPLSPSEGVSLTMKKANCLIHNCPKESHAKGYCRRHYGQIWRHGRITSIKEVRSFNMRMMAGDRITERILGTERELKKSKQMYNVVVGWQNRLKWRREIEGMEHELEQLNEQLRNAEKGQDENGDKLRDGHRPKTPGNEGQS